MAKSIIGTVTTYQGHGYGMRPGHKVWIVAVMPAAAGPDPDAAYLTTDDDIARAGGVHPDDRVEVAPWIHGHFSMASCDPVASELAGVC